MSLHLDYAEISRQARRIVDANRAKTIIEHVQATQPASTPIPKKLKYTRSTTGCLACRTHKVKCDETYPACLRCVAGQRECQYPSPKDKGRKRKSSTKDSAEPSPPDGSDRDKRPRQSQSQSQSVTRLMEEEDERGVGDKDYSLAAEPGKHSLAAGGRPSMSQNKHDDGGVATAEDWVAEMVNGATPDFSFLNDFIPFVSPPSMNTVPASTSPSGALSGTTPNGLAKPVLPLGGAPPSSASSSRHKALPQFDNLQKSLLLNRRMFKVGDGQVLAEGESDRTPSLPPSMRHPRLLMVDTILHASMADDALFEFGPSHRQRNLSNISLNAGTIDVLSNAFPSPTARFIFHHYCNTASRILVTMGNIGPNPLLALCTPVKLLDTNSAASAAIRMSMLSVGLAHFTHETKEAVGPNELGTSWAVLKENLKEMSNRFKKAALSNITLAAKGEADPQQIDSILAACTLLCIRDVISADPTWRDNLEFAMNLMGRKGGPQAMLSGTGYSFTRRYLLENLATHDVFASFITGKEPAVLGNYDTWWFDSVETSQTRWEWESVERSFGISRAMVDLVARKRRLDVRLDGGSQEMWDVAQHFERESHCLLLELDIWGNSLNALPQHVRVTCGDYIYKYMAVVFILADILEQPTSTPRIVKSIDYILELLAEAAAMRMSVMLIWPLLIAGVFALPAKRERVTGLFDAFQGDYCEDLEVARELLFEQWRGIDAGEGKQPWDRVMHKLGKYVLLI
ncbi:hypothetical protein IAU60_004926 [Kwoniella sp. DSM 27419]